MDYSDQLITFISGEVSPQQNTNKEKESCNVTTVPESERIVQLSHSGDKEVHNAIDISYIPEDNINNLTSSQKKSFKSSIMSVAQAQHLAHDRVANGGGELSFGQIGNSINNS